MKTALDHHLLFQQPLFFLRKKVVLLTFFQSIVDKIVLVPCFEVSMGKNHTIIWLNGLPKIKIWNWSGIAKRRNQLDFAKSTFLKQNQPTKSNFRGTCIISFFTISSNMCLYSSMQSFIKNINFGG